MLSTKEKRLLKSFAHPLKPIIQIGKDGLSDNLLITISQGLKSHELIKVSVLESCPDPKEQLILDICARCHCEIVQTIGRTLVF
ncbi:MAG: ribosome assembly RNA-binding protein YhbY [Erysipelothrix sp.]|nr:ribosome assembly RNA-binding protein YhbY [Erysipelothrix sp.]